MNISALRKEKNKITLILGVLCVIGVMAYIFNKPAEEVPLDMDFSKKAQKSPKAKTRNKSNKIIKPDPAYKEAPEFEDFQVIAKFFVHAMKPYEAEVKEWTQEIVSLRTQREKIKLYEDGALAAKNEAEMYKFKNQSAAIKNGKTFLMENNENQRPEKGSDDIIDFERVSSTESIQSQYRLTDIRLTLFVVGNKYSKTSASFKVVDEAFLSVKTNQVFASQFLVINLDDESFCASIRDLNTDKESRVCRN